MTWMPRSSARSISARLARRTAVAVAGALLVLGLVASAPSARVRQASSNVGVSITFSVVMPPAASASVTFTGGIADITKQSIAALPGGLKTVKTSQNGWELTPFGTETVNALDFLAGQREPGTPILGTARLENGATLTASVNGGAQQTITNGAFSLGAGDGGSAAPRPTLSVSPASVPAGESVTISGTVAGDCPDGSTVTVISDAFVLADRYAGRPAVYADVRAKGAFKVSTQIPATRRPGSYTITALCYRDLGVTAELRVTAPVTQPAASRARVTMRTAAFERASRAAIE
jgi:hypothetical protein